MVEPIIETAFVRILYPTLSLNNAINYSALSQYIAGRSSIPLQTSTGVHTFTLLQRLVFFCTRLVTMHILNLPVVWRD